MISPYVVSAYINPNNTMITVNFNENMTIGPYWNTSDFDMFITGDWAPYNFTYELLYV